MPAKFGDIQALIINIKHSTNIMIRKYNCHNCNEENTIDLHEIINIQGNHNGIIADTSNLDIMFSTMNKNMFPIDYKINCRKCGTPNIINLLV